MYSKTSLVCKLISRNWSTIRHGLVSRVREVAEKQPEQIGCGKMIQSHGDEMLIPLLHASRWAVIMHMRRSLSFIISWTPTCIFIHCTMIIRIDFSGSCTDVAEPNLVSEDSQHSEYHPVIRIVHILFLTWTNISVSTKFRWMIVPCLCCSMQLVVSAC